MPSCHRLRVPLLSSLVVTLSACGPAGASGQTARESLEWHEVAWSDGTVRVGLVRPDPAMAGPHPVVFALPWGAGTAGLVETFVASYWLTEPAARGYYVVSPVIRGPTLAYTAQEVLPAIFAWMDQMLDYDPQRVALVGASNGGTGAFHAALSQPERFHALLTLPGQYSGPEEELAKLAGKPIYFLVGQLDDRWIELTQATRASLAAVGIDSGIRVLGGQGHSLRIDPRLLLDWLDTQLAYEPG